MPPDNTNDLSALRQKLVDELKGNDYIESEQVEAAFLNVSRHLFVPGEPLDKVYSDEAITTKRNTDGVPISSSSQPAIMAIMLEQLALEPGHRVLEIGAGTGYNAALMAHIVGDTGYVVTVDIDEDIVTAAREHLSAAGFDNVEVVCADGGFGHPDGAPYDRIVLTVGAWDVVPAWGEQMKTEGRLLLPLSLGGTQVSVAFERADGRFESVSVKGCGFMGIRGHAAAPESGAALGASHGLHLSVNDDRAVNGELVYGWLTGLSEDRPTTVTVEPSDVLYGGLGLWLGLHERGLCQLHASGEPAGRSFVPAVVEFNSGTSKYTVTAGLLGEYGMCLFTRPARRLHSQGATHRSGEVELYVRSYGEGENLAEHLIHQVIAWDQAGRPSLEGLRISAYSKETDYSPSTDEFVIPKTWTKLVVAWQNSSENPATDNVR